MSKINESNTYDDHDYLILFEELFNVGCSDNAQTMTSPEQDPSTILPQFVREHNFLNTFMSLNDSVRLNIGHKIFDLIKSCSFDGRNCTDERWTSNTLSFFQFGLIADFLEELLVQNMETASHSTQTIQKIWEHLI